MPPTGIFSIFSIFDQGGGRAAVEWVRGNMKGGVRVSKTSNINTGSEGKVRDPTWLRPCSTSGTPGRDRPASRDPPPLSFASAAPDAPSCAPSQAAPPPRASSSTANRSSAAPKLARYRSPSEPSGALAALAASAAPAAPTRLRRYAPWPKAHGSSTGPAPSSPKRLLSSGSAHCPASPSPRSPSAALPASSSESHR